MTSHRDRGLFWSRVVRWGLLAAIAAFYGWLHLEFVTEHRTAALLAEEGVSARAVVIEDVGDKGGFRDHADRVKYEYHVDRRAYRQAETVWAGELGRLTAGDTVSIRYAADAPENARLIQSSYRATLLLAMAFFDLILVIVIIALWREKRR